MYDDDEDDEKDEEDEEEEKEEEEEDLEAAAGDDSLSLQAEMVLLHLCTQTAQTHALYMMVICSIQVIPDLLSPTMLAMSYVILTFTQCMASLSMIYVYV